MYALSIGSGVLGAGLAVGAWALVVVVALGVGASDWVVFVVVVVACVPALYLGSRVSLALSKGVFGSASMALISYMVAFLLLFLAAFVVTAVAVVGSTY
jgi:hypothetical protein